MRKLQDALTPSGWLKGLLFALAGLLSGLVWALLARLIDTQSLRFMLTALAEPDLWLTALFLGLVVLILSLLTTSLFTCNLIVGAATMVLAFVNYFKVLITAVPLSIGDFSLIGQMGDIASLNSESITLSRNSTLAIIFAVVWLLITLFFSRPLRLRWKWSALGGLAAAAVFAVLFWFASNPLVFSPLGAEVGNALSQASANQSCGVVLGLWRSFYRQNTLDLGRDYSQAYMDEVVAQVEDYTAGQTDAASQVKPNIIFILSESFFDTTTLEGVTYEEDPVADFHALQQEGVSGRFYTRTLGYGTCNIELEIMTGINTALLSGEDLYSWDPAIFSRLPSVPSVLQDNGYYTAMIHLYNDSIYNRTGFFTQLGFDDLYFTDDFAQFHTPAAGAEDYWAYMGRHISGRYYSDALMTDLLISLYEKQKAESDGPVFLYGISMENHSSYVDGKYPDDELTVSPQSTLTGEAAENILYLSQGVSNASAALGELADYFSTVDEPTIIVFYGDHRPGLGLTEGGYVYSELGMVSPDKTQWTMEDYEELFSTDYLIWANDAALLPQAAGTTADSSSNYLGVELLDLAGVEKPLYWKLLSQLSEHRSIDTVFYHRSADGLLTEQAPEDGQGGLGLSLLTDLLNDAIYGKQYVTNRIK